MDRFATGQTGELFFPASSGVGERYARIWAPTNVRAIVQIAHGMAEHSARYAHLACALMRAGYAVYVGDHAGHGYSATKEQYGFMGEVDGWTGMLDDMAHLSRLAWNAHPDRPFFLLGHSMGSFLARCYAMEYGRTMQGLVLSGTGDYNPALPMGVRLANWTVRRNGLHYRSAMLNKLAVGAFNRRYGRAGGCDWLSRDAQVVEAYAADPMCGFALTSAGYRDLFTGMKLATEPGWAHKIPRELPILIFSGDGDPVGDYGRGVRNVAEQLEAAGNKLVTCRIYPGGRHEMLNETERDDVERLVLDWFDGCLANGA